MSISQHCPKCMNPSLDIKKAVLAGQTSTASCGHCGWAGALSDAPAAVMAGEEFHGVEALSLDLMELLLRTFYGPMIVTLEHRGLLPTKMPPDAKDMTKDQIEFHNARADEARGHVCKRMVETGIETILLAAGEAQDIMKAEPRSSVTVTKAEA